MKKILYILFCLLPVLGGKAQTIYKDQIRIEKESATRSEDNRLTVSMDIILQPNLKMSSNNVTTLTPFIEANGQTKQLPSIVIYGRKRQLINQRNHQTPESAYTVVRRKGKTEQKVNYLIQIPYEGWMRKANMKLNVDVCGCCDMIEENSGEKIAQLNIAPLKLQPVVAYITPQEEAVKHRAVEGRAFLDFPVNKYIIYPDYRRNSDELAKVRATIDTVRNDNNIKLTGISIHGYASPEGSYTHNTYLAKNRTQALVDYVTSYYNFDLKLITSDFTPEDWEGFRKFVIASTIDKKDEILSLMDDVNMDADVKEHSIAKLVGPQAYQYLLQECYPALRHSDYVVSYTVRGFDLEESKEIINKHPQQLSLKELYLIAQSYQTGSEEFNHAFQVAAIMFPNDPTANLNAAAVEIQKGGDLAIAKKHLAKADQKAAETLNNLGIVSMMEDDFKAAENYFNAAKAAGLTEQANANLKELAKKQNYPIK
ncbi:DUF3868 domain-containing protein [Bacteroides sp.]|uniref:DUF3868 domain-containing protein n=1 Tax=Bacteroides sp. TaxID=29523 RepID=UPI002629327C|nr:DUF3868 domain-containing protein [Bacteroides sp.]MDD3038942.1 DUF3868 domain-containing protein [Bacteroides sp.]